MGYTRTWIPSTFPYTNNLPVWKTICQDIHDNMILAGLVQTDDVGQLDIQGVSALPADGTFAGFRVYRFNDALQASCPIVIKLNFGCGVVGQYSSTASWKIPRTIRIGVHIGKETDGYGNVTSVAYDTTYQCPQSLDGSASATTVPVSAGLSMICYNEELGFFGFIYGSGSRNSYANTYTGCSLGILIQRDIDSNGMPIDSGFSFIRQDGSGNWSTDNWNGNRSYQNPAIQIYINKDGTTAYTAQTFALRPGGTSTTPINGVPQTHPVYLFTPELKRMQTLVSYRTPDISVGTEFRLEINPGVIRNFIALGNENRLSVSQNDGDTASFAMLYE